jgi:hypothetical protein
MISVLCCSIVVVNVPSWNICNWGLKRFIFLDDLPYDSAAIRTSQLSQSFSARVLGSGRSSPSQRAGLPLRADVSKKLHFGLPHTFHIKALRLDSLCVEFFHHTQ